MWGAGVNLTLLDYVLVLLIVLTIWSGKLYYRFCMRPGIKGWQGEKRLRKLLDLFEFEAVHNVYVPNSKGKYAQIDHIVKFQNTLGVIETKNYSGEIRGGKYGRKWVQTINGYDRNTPNPLWQVKRQVAHLQDMLPNASIWGTVVYAGEAKFPQGTPKNVSTYEEFRHYIADYKIRKNLCDHSPALEAAWLEVIEQANQSSRAKRRQHLIDIGQGNGWSWHKFAVSAQFVLFTLSALGLGTYRFAM